MTVILVFWLAACGPSSPAVIAAPEAVEASTPPNPGSCVATWAWDGDDDGRDDAVGTEMLDPKGKLVRLERDLDLDGVADFVNTWAYERGKVVELTEDHDGDGRIDWVKTKRWEGGHVVEVTIDDDADGLLDRVEASTFGADGLEAWVGVDQDGDGDWDRNTWYGYDDDGRRVTEELDHDGDGLPNLFTALSYDAAGRLVRSEGDRQGDGVVELVVAITYDGPEGLSGTIVEDDDNDGLAEQVTVEAYDEQGRLVARRIEEGLDADGPRLDVVITYGSGFVGWEGVQDFGGSIGPVPVAVEAWSDDAGRPTETLVSVDGSRERERWAYTCF